MTKDRVWWWSHKNSNSSARFSGCRDHFFRRLTLESPLLTAPDPRQLLVALVPTEIERLNQHLADRNKLTTAVVIDTLRFTTTACQALQVGARSVQVAPTIERAHRMAEACSPTALLCGERLGHRIEGFDLGNSPVEVTRDQVDGRDLVFTTTNGTLAVEAVQHLPTILLAALVNRQATSRFVHDHTSGDTIIVCAGTNGHVTWEDVLTAGAIIDLLISPAADFAYGNDSALLAHSAWQNWLANAGQLSSTADGKLSSTAGGGGNSDQRTKQSGLTEQATARLLAELSRSLGGRNLLKSGYQRDLQFAAQLDRLPVVARNLPGQFHCFVKH